MRKRLCRGIVRKHRLPVLADLRKQLEYDPDTGKLRWLTKSKRGRPRRTGWFEPKVVEPHGYRTISFEGVVLYVHRVVWALMIGRWPKHEIDHIDGNRGNNRWANLREATILKNSRNRRDAQPPDFT